MSRIDYGVDAPGVLRNLFLSGVGCAVAGFLVGKYWASGFLSAALINCGGWLIFSGLLMLIYVKRGKFHHRDRMLMMVGWKGSEKVLDVGTGRGLLLVGAAQRAPQGQLVGIDVWSQIDLSSNSPANTQRNLELEGVSDRCELKSEDAQRMSFEDNSFDVILSNLCLHNIPEKEGRARACREIARVLKPGGIALISDFMKTDEYVKTFREAGLNVERTPPYWLDTFPPLRVVKAWKS